MHRPKWFASLLALAIVPAIVAGEGDAKRLQGAWVVESAQVGGKPFDRLKGGTLTFKDNVAVMRSKLPGGREDVDENPYELDESKTPKRITLFQKKNRDKGVQRGIYELEGDRLKLCMSAPGAEEYPTDFIAKDCLLLTLKRQEK
jgi:uncharacterized protein (TIGR03067 family)